MYVPGDNLGEVPHLGIRVGVAHIRNKGVVWTRFRRLLEQLYKIMINDFMFCGVDFVHPLNIVSKEEIDIS